MKDIKNLQIKNLPELRRLYWNRIKIDPKTFKLHDLDFPHLQKVDIKYTNLEILSLPESVEKINITSLKDHHIDVINKPKLKILHL